MNTVVVKLKKVKTVKKLAIKKKSLKKEVDIKKVNDQIAKNFQTTIEKSQKIKYKVILLITDKNVTKKRWSNRKTNTNKKSKDDPKLKKKPTK